MAAKNKKEKSGNTNQSNKNSEPEKPEEKKEAGENTAIEEKPAVNQETEKTTIDAETIDAETIDAETIDAETIDADIINLPEGKIEIEDPPETIDAETIDADIINLPEGKIEIEDPPELLELQRIFRRDDGGFIEEWIVPETGELWAYTGKCQTLLTFPHPMIPGKKVQGPVTMEFDIQGDPQNYIEANRWFEASRAQEEAAAQMQIDREQAAGNPGYMVEGEPQGRIKAFTEAEMLGLPPVSQDIRQVEPTRPVRAQKNRPIAERLKEGNPFSNPYK